MGYRRLYLCQGLKHVPVIHPWDVEYKECPPSGMSILDETVDGQLVTEKDPREFGWSAVLVRRENMLLEDRGDYILVGEGHDLDWYCPECRDEAVAKGAR